MWSIVCVVNERVRPHVLIPPRLPFSVGCGWAVMRATGRKHGMEGTRSGWFQGMGLEFSRIAIAREEKLEQPGRLLLSAQQQQTILLTPSPSRGTATRGCRAASRRLVFWCPAAALRHRIPGPTAIPPKDLVSHQGQQGTINCPVSTPPPNEPSGFPRRSLSVFLAAPRPSPSILSHCVTLHRVTDGALALRLWHAARAPANNIQSLSKW